MSGDRETKSDPDAIAPETRESDTRGAGAGAGGPQALTNITSHCAVAGRGGVAIYAAPGATIKLPAAPVIPSCTQFQRPEVNPDFVNRKGIQDQIDAVFPREATATTESKLLLLTTHGMGGVGKTQLAQHHYLTTPYPYALRAWFYADSPQVLTLNFEKLGKKVGLPFNDSMSPQDKVEMTKEWLERQPPSLLIFDNVERPQDLEGFKPQLGHHHILITSRNRLPFPGAIAVDINVMEPEEAITLLKTMLQTHLGPRAYDESEENAINALVLDELGRLPLAIAQAGAYIRENQPLSIADYLTCYQAHKAELLSRTEPDTPVHPEFRRQDSAEGLRWANKHEPVWLTYDLSMQKITARLPQAIALLNHMSFLHADAQPHFLLQRLLDRPIPDTETTPTSSVTTTPDLLLRDCLKALKQYALIRSDTSQAEISLHRLLQTILRSKLGAEAQLPFLFKAYKAVDASYLSAIEEHRRDYTQVKALIGHYECVIAHCDKVTSESTEIQEQVKRSLGALLGNLGNAQGNLGDHVTSKSHFERTLAIQESDYGADHVEVALTLNNLGTACGALGDHVTQKSHLERALAIKESYYGADHVEVAGTLNNLGTACGALGDHVTSKSHFERALAIKESYYGADHVEVAKTLGNLGTACGALGDHVTKKSYLERALAIQESYYGADHVEVAKTLGNLGNACGDLGDHVTQKSHLERALAIQESYYGADHVEVAKTLGNLGNACGALGDHVTEKSYLERALVILESYYGADHVESAITRFNLADTVANMGNIAQALSLLEDCQRIFSSQPGGAQYLPQCEGNRQIFLARQAASTESAYLMACRLAREGKLEQAHSAFELALSESPSARVMLEYANFLIHRRGDWSRALPYLWEAVDQADQSIQFLSIECDGLGEVLHAWLAGKSEIRVSTQVLGYWLLCRYWHELGDTERIKERLNLWCRENTTHVNSAVSNSSWYLLGHAALLGKNSVLAAQAFSCVEELPEETQGLMLSLTCFLPAGFGDFDLESHRQLTQLSCTHFSLSPAVSSTVLYGDEDAIGDESKDVAPG